MRLLLLAASGLVPLLLMLAWGISFLVDDRREQAERSVLELSRALSTAIDAELRSVESLLHHLGTSDELERADFREFHSSMGRTAEQLGWRQIVLTDGDGTPIFRTNETFGTTGRTPVESESLRRAIQTQKSAVSGVVVSPRTGDDTFAVRVPVMRGGKLVYVITAVLSTDRIGAVLTRQSIPSGSVAAIFDQAHQRIARSQASPSKRPSDSLLAMLESGKSQGTGVTTTVEGNQSYTGFTRLPNSGWAVAVGNSVELANAGLLTLLRALALGLAASLALAVLLAWLLSRRVLGPIDTLKHGAAALGRGDPVDLPPLDIVELDDVAVALKDAAAERDRAMQDRERTVAEREKLAAQITDALRMAEDANRSKDQFLAMLGHELRNPLAPISTAVQLMAMKGDEKTAGERRIIERQLVHVTRLVDDLLDVSRITSGRLAIRREPVRLAQVLSHVVETIRPSLLQHTLHSQLADDIEQAWVMGDEDRLIQVFNNLLVNAIKFTPQGRTIEVRARLSGGEAWVEVEDEGVGMTPEDLSRVFDLFYQAPQSADRARGGLGLGLSIVRSLVQMHRGSVHAHSEGEGQGSCITVRLPLCEAPAEAAPAPAVPTSRGQAAVLLVDDNEDAADTCATLLEMTGYTVRVGYSPDAALQILREYTPDLAILDIGLPGMSGYELAGRMKSPEVGYRGKLVALTGYGQATDMARSREAGFDAHLTKPVAPEDLLETVKRLTSAL